MLFQRVGDIFKAELAEGLSRKAAHVVQSMVHVRAACHGRYILVFLFDKGGGQKVSQGPGSTNLSGLTHDVLEQAKSCILDYIRLRLP